MMSETITRNDLKAILDSVLPSTAVDYIVEQGTSGIWTYRKWNSGIAECWGQKSQTITGVSGSVPFTGYKYDFSTESYPNGLFITAPILSVSVAVGSNYCVTSYAKSYQTYCSFAASSNASGSKDCTADLHAIGRWK